MTLKAIIVAATLLLGHSASGATGPQSDKRAEPDLCTVAHALFDRAADVQSKDPAAAKPLFARAAAEYERVLARPLAPSTRASVLTNAGAAHHLAGDLGHAMLDLRRAELLSPAAPHVRERLMAARAALKGETNNAAPVAAPAHDTNILLLARDLALSVPRHWLWRIAAVGYVGFFSALLLRLLVPNAPLRRHGSAAMTAFGALCAISAVGLAGLHLRDVNAQSQAIVVIETIGRSEPDDLTGAPSAPAPLKPGAELRILDERTGGDGRTWVRVAPSDATPAPEEVPVWIPNSAAARVFDHHGWK